MVINFCGKPLHISFGKAKEGRHEKAGKVPSCLGFLCVFPQCFSIVFWFLACVIWPIIDHNPSGFFFHIIIIRFGFAQILYFLASHFVGFINSCGKQNQILIFMRIFPRRGLIYKKFCATIRGYEALRRTRPRRLWNEN